MICDNCIKADVCLKNHIKSDLVYRSDGEQKLYCEHFKDKDLVVELPCKVGDTIYVIPSETNYRLNVLHNYSENNRVYEQVVNKISFFEDNVYLLRTCDGMHACLSECYKINWFLIKEEAEKALKEIEQA